MPLIIHDFPLRFDSPVTKKRSSAAICLKSIMSAILLPFSFKDPKIVKHSENLSKYINLLLQINGKRRRGSRDE